MLVSYIAMVVHVPTADIATPSITSDSKNVLSE